jgi:hypothetical protein
VKLVQTFDSCDGPLPWRASDSCVLIQARGEGSGQATARARFYVPSAEMKVSYAIVLLPIQGQQEVAPASVTTGGARWTVYPRVADPNRPGVLARLPLTADGTDGQSDVPQGLELVTGASWYEVALAVDQSVYQANGDWALIVAWELLGCIEPRARPAVFGACQLTAPTPSTIGQLG